VYTWDGNRWYDKSYLSPPANIISKLNALIKENLNEEDALISDQKELLTRAQTARAAKQYDRAEQIVRRLLNNDPFNLAVLSILCAVLRERGKPLKAIEETEPFRKSSNTALLTSRAAAFCDLERWEEAKKEIGRALAIKRSEEAFLVVKRIKKVRPDLYEKD
jgi:predicted Zn-dependent protease